MEKKEQKLAKEGKKNQSESNDNVYDRKDQ